MATNFLYHLCKILIIRGSGSWKKNSLLNLLRQQPDIHKIDLHAKDPYEAKYQFLINKQESTGLKHFNDTKAFIEYSNYMADVYKHSEEYNSNNKRKILIVLDEMIGDIPSNKKFNPMVAESFIREIKLHFSLKLRFIKDCYFTVSNKIRLNSTDYFVMKILVEQEL